MLSVRALKLLCPHRFMLNENTVLMSGEYLTFSISGSEQQICFLPDGTRDIDSSL